MSLAAPKHEEEIEAQKAAQEAKRLAHTYGAVWKDGRVTAHFVEPPKKGEIVGKQSGDVPLVWINGSVQVTERARKMGVRLFAEVCASDGCPEKADRWREAMRHAGKVAIRNVDELYPPTVHRLRREAATGVKEGMVYDASVGELVPATEDAMITRVAELAESAGIGTPTREDAKAAKKASA